MNTFSSAQILTRATCVTKRHAQFAQGIDTAIFFLNSGVARVEYVDPV